MQEPRDGDFVAYIDALQRESAARLAQQHVNIFEVAFPSKAATPVVGHKATAPSPAGGQSSANGFAQREQSARLFKALVAAVVGAVSLLSWLGGSGPFSLIVSAVLLAYGVPRLVAAYRGQRNRPDTKAAIDHVFGRSGTPTAGAQK